MILKKLKCREESESPVISEKKMFFDELFTNDSIENHSINKKNFFLILIFKMNFQDQKFDDEIKG